MDPEEAFPSSGGRFLSEVAEQRPASDRAGRVGEVMPGVDGVVSQPPLPGLWRQAEDRQLDLLPQRAVAPVRPGRQDVQCPSLELAYPEGAQQLGGRKAGNDAGR